MNELELNKKSYKLLIVEDDTTIRDGVAEFFKEMGYDIISTSNAEEAINIFEEEDINLIILDIMLPGMSGLEFLQKIRLNSLVPVVILTALNDEQTQLRLFDEYADDYLTKPFSLMILKRRVDALLRHFYANTQFIKLGEAEVDFRAFKAYYNQKEVSLTTKEFKVLEYLLKNRGLILTREKILDHIWSEEEGPYERVIDVYIKNLRQKLHLDCIKTVKGAGYKMEIL